MKKKNQQPKAPTLNEMLDTKNRVEQAKRVAMLFNPVVDIIVRFDGRSGLISLNVIGGEISGTDARMILNKATEKLIQEEALAAAQKEMQANQVPVPNEVDLPADLGVTA